MVLYLGCPHLLYDLGEIGARRSARDAVVCHSVPRKSAQGRSYLSRGLYLHVRLTVSPHDNLGAETALVKYVYCVTQCIICGIVTYNEPFKAKAQTAIFKAPVRTAL